MTRETKIGLMVAVSFICLVGIVVATRWRRGVDPNQMVEIKPKEPAPAANGDNPPPSGAGKSNPVITAGFEGSPPARLPVAGDNTPPLVAIAPPGGNNADPSLPALPALPSVGDPAPSLPSAPPPNSAPPPPPPSAGGNVGSLGAPSGNNPPPSLESVVPPPTAPIGGPPSPGSSTPGTSTPPTLPSGNANDDQLRAQLQALKIQQEKQATANVPGVAPPMPPDPFKKVDDALNNLVNRGNAGANQFAQNTNNKIDEVLNKGVGAANKGLDKVAQGIDQFNKIPSLPPVGNNPPAPPALPKDNNVPFPPAPVGGNNSLPPISTPKDGNVPFPPAPIGGSAALPTAPPKDNNSRLPQAPLGSNSPAPVIPAPKDSGVPFPAPPTSSGGNNFSGVPAPQGGNSPPPTPGVPGSSFGAPPITNTNATSGPGFTIPAPGGGASVSVHDLMTYPVRGGETFAGISKAYYGSDKYGNALLAFNRDHGGNPTLTTPQPGQKILLPDVAFLQRQYASLIADAGPVGSGSPVIVNQPVPLAPKINFAPMTPSPDATKNYRVAGQGQMIWQVAVQTLGDGNRWPEILRLNPGLQTLQPIPGGTMLRMPANANVP